MGFGYIYFDKDKLFWIFELLSKRFLLVDRFFVILEVFSEMLLWSCSYVFLFFLLSFFFRFSLWIILSRFLNFFLIFFFGVLVIFCFIFFSFFCLDFVLFFFVVFILVYFSFLDFGNFVDVFIFELVLLLEILCGRVIDGWFWFILCFIFILFRLYFLLIEFIIFFLLNLVLGFFLVFDIYLLYVGICFLVV